MKNIVGSITADKNTRIDFTAADGRSLVEKFRNFSWSSTAYSEENPAVFSISFDAPDGDGYLNAQLESDGNFFVQIEVRKKVKRFGLLPGHEKAYSDVSGIRPSEVELFFEKIATCNLDEIYLGIKNKSQGVFACLNVK